MAGSVNKVILVGNVGGDPEIRNFQSGGRIANLSIATSEKWSDKHTGERKERTEWHRVSILNEGLIRVIENYIKKGSKLYIEGQLETRKWQDANGNDRYSTEVVLRPYRGELVILNTQQGSPQAYNPGQPSEEYSQQMDDQNNNPFDDEIPF